ncbi:FkbM family methyltransferase [Dinoroseobacter sp. S76]|uniref:FkbM family methyltransferase n=1 Tax=Dinoroseobacter sp. S76 TaxID=3415124 RepID=UPI003C7A0A75
MTAPSLSDRLRARLAPFLAQDSETALAPVAEPLNSLLARYRVPPHTLPQKTAFLEDRAAEIDALEGMLDDATSRTRLEEFFAAKLLGPTRFAMTARDRWEAHVAAHDRVISRQPDEAGLEMHSLSFGDTPLHYLAPYGNAISPFLERQYFLDRDGLRIGPEPGDIALDFGAGAGDTSLAFAAVVGPKGRVLAIEPTPTELALQARNRAANPDLSQRITSLPAAISDRDGEEIHLAGTTTGAHIAPEGQTSGPKAVTTTLDALVASQSLPRVDLIKMDIEGMELRALQGGLQILQRFAPKLAICTYHGWQIFELLPWLRRTLPEHSLHLETHSPIAAETVIYAQPRSPAPASDPRPLP